MAQRLTLFIVIGMVLGVVAGFILNLCYVPGDPTLVVWADMLRLLPEVFLRLITMIIALLVFSTIVTGIAATGDSAALGRIGGKALAWFIPASLISLLIGMALANLLQPGARMRLTATAPLGDLATKDLSFRHFVLEVFPKSPFEAMAQNNILQILLFSVFVGVALTSIGERGAVLLRGAEALAELMLRITDYVMLFAPFAVFGAIAAIIALKGLGILVSYGLLIGDVYLGLAVLWVVLLLVGSLFLGRKVLTLFRYIREAALLSFSTASSEASLPKLFEQLDRFGVPRRISGFVLPLGYSFNLDGSMMYMSFATLFIAQAYGIHLPLETQLLMLLTLMVSSKGIAGVPRASLVVIAATLGQFGLPVDGIALLLGVDTFLDMGRSATNVVGNAVATAVITKSEGMLQVPLDPAPEVPHAPSHTPEHGRRGLNLDPEQ
jgi:Na+/H+-dicarboxylate symporter